MLTYEDVLKLNDSDKIRHYIDIGKNAETEKKKVRTDERKGKSKSSTSYEVVLSSGLDVVIEKNQDQFIFMPSQDRYVIKTEAGMKNIKDMCLKEFENFFTPFPSKGIEINSLLIDKIENKYELSDIYHMIKEENELLRQGMISWPIYRSRSMRVIELCMKIEPRLWKNIMVKTPMLSVTSEKYDISFIALTYALYLSFGYDAASYFVETYVKSSMKFISYITSDYALISNFENMIFEKKSKKNVFNDMFMADEINYTPKRLIDYLCYDLYTQGYHSIPLQTYIDYIKMSYAYEDGKVNDKYPPFLETYHDIITLKCKEKEISINEIKFNLSYRKFKHKYSEEVKEDDDSQIFYEDEEIALLIPKNQKELIEEGNQLGHCVGSYRKRVSNGECVILFARRKMNLGQSYLTVELIPIFSDSEKTYSIAQIQGDCKRTELTKEEISYFKKFADKFGFKIGNRHLL